MLFLQFSPSILYTCTSLNPNPFNVPPPNQSALHLTNEKTIFTMLFFHFIYVQPIPIFLPHLNEIQPIKLFSQFYLPILCIYIYFYYILHFHLIESCM